MDKWVKKNNFPLKKCRQFQISPHLGCLLHSVVPPRIQFASPSGRQERASWYFARQTRSLPRCSFRPPGDLLCTSGTPVCGPGRNKINKWKLFFNTTVLLTRFLSMQLLQNVCPHEVVTGCQSKRRQSGQLKSPSWKVKNWFTTWLTLYLQKNEVKKIIITLTF